MQKHKFEDVKKMMDRHKQKVRYNKDKLTVLTIIDGIYGGINNINDRIRDIYDVIGYELPEYTDIMESEEKRDSYKILGEVFSCIDSRIFGSLPDEMRDIFVDCVMDCLPPEMQVDLSLTPTGFNTYSLKVGALSFEYHDNTVSQPSEAGCQLPPPPSGNPRADARRAFFANDAIPLSGGHVNLKKK